MHTNSRKKQLASQCYPLAHATGLYMAKSSTASQCNAPLCTMTGAHSQMQNRLERHGSPAACLQENVPARPNANGTNLTGMQHNVAHPS